MKKMLMMLALALLVVPVAAQAQQGMTAEEEAWFDLIRADIRADKASMVRQAMNLNAEHLTAFEPIYADYEVELKQIWDSHLELIEAYAASYEDMSDEVANTLAEWAMELEVQRIQLLKETFRTMSDAIGAVHAARFIQIENRIDMLVNLEIMSQMPMLQPID
jgi:hypothetical protein